MGQYWVKPYFWPDFDVFTLMWFFWNPRKIFQFRFSRRPIFVPCKSQMGSILICDLIATRRSLDIRSLQKTFKSSHLIMSYRGTFQTWKSMCAGQVSPGSSNWIRSCREIVITAGAHNRATKKWKEKILTSKE